jgi:hypothetical protein
MKPYLFVPFLREALEKTFEDAPFVAVYATKTYLVAQAGGLRRLKVVVIKAPDGRLSGHQLVYLLGRGYGVFVVHPDLLEALLVLYTKPLPFSRTPDELDWKTLNLAAVSKVYLPAYILEGGERP